MERGKLVHEQKCIRGALLLANLASYAHCMLERFYPRCIRPSIPS